MENFLRKLNICHKCLISKALTPEAEFKEFERRLKFKPRLKYGWFRLKLYSMFQDLSRCSMETDFGGFKTRLKFIKFGHCLYYISKN